jgi:dipeptidase
MKKLKISPDFTIEDIHKIRRYHYEQTKNMTFEEYKKDLKKGVDEFHRALQKSK